MAVSGHRAIAISAAKAAVDNEFPAATLARAFTTSGSGDDHGATNSDDDGDGDNSDSERSNQNRSC